MTLGYSAGKCMCVSGGGGQSERGEGGEKYLWSLMRNSNMAGK